MEELDLSRYLGTWYAVASIPTAFERKCVQGTTAIYPLLPSGEIEVVNVCFSATGERIEARGRAWVPNPREPAKLQVGFVSFLGLRLLPADYTYAVVGHPTRRYGWVLSRTSTLPAEVLAGIRRRREDQGYDGSQFRVIDQRVHARP